MLTDNTLSDNIVFRTLKILTKLEKQTILMISKLHSCYEFLELHVHCVLFHKHKSTTSYQVTFMTLKRVPCPIPSLSLKNEWSGKVLAMSRLIIRSQAELLYTNNRYSTLYMYHDTTKKTPGKNSYNLIKLFICKTSTCSRLKCLKHQIWAWIKKL